MVEQDYLSTRDKVIDRVVEDSIVEGRLRTVIESFSLLPLSVQRQAVERIVKAQAVVAKECIDKREPITLPYIGKVVIKKGKLIEIEVMTEVAKDLGYEDITSIPKNKYDELLKNYKETISNKAIKNRKVRSNNRKAVTNAKVKTFNLKTLKKT